MQYAELHARSAFSFLEGASQPEDLVARAAELSIHALAITDLNNLAGAVRFYKAAKAHGIKPLIGAEVKLWNGARLPLLVENRRGYQHLCQLLTQIALRAAKGAGFAEPEDLAQHAQGLVCLTGGLDGPLAHTLRARENPNQLLETLMGIYGAKQVYAEVQRHALRSEERFNQHVLALAEKYHLPVLASNGVLHDKPASRALLDVLTCIKHHTKITTAGKLLLSNSERSLKTPRQMYALFKDQPQALANGLELAARLQFDLKQNLGYQFPPYPVPEGGSMDSYLRAMTYQGAYFRYGSPLPARVKQQLERELELIAKLELAGYFLIVWDIVQFCRSRDILCQGRGSAANSAVCYALGITAVDPIKMDLLFERFLSEERGEWPDIDLDLPSGAERESVIQYVYQRYGQRGAAMTSVAITYQGKLAVREVGKVLGFEQPQIERLSKLIPAYGFKGADESASQKLAEAGFSLEYPLVRQLHDLVLEIIDLPRHLGQHPGGMVICQGRLDEFVPLEPAAMPDRVIVQWDKDDCADMGIIKVDLLGLGMMAALKESVDLIRDHYDAEVDLARLPADDTAVYEALQRADTVGWFQVESRAQMSALPRTRPVRFYDIVVQVAIIRPGPIVGKMASPYIRRRQGLEAPVCLHPSLEPVLSRTLGVPLFQEQLLRMAMIVAGFTGGEAEELRRALGSKRSRAAMESIETKLRRGMEQKGISGATQDQIVTAVTSFALYGFPESHAASFALLAYASGYLKVHYLAAFTAALLNNQPMGFYSPSTLVKDAQRHGQRFLPIDINLSADKCTLVQRDESFCIRMGLSYVRGLAHSVIAEILAARTRSGPFASIEELKLRVPAVNKIHLRNLAAVGALNPLPDNPDGFHRRDAIWLAELVARPVTPLLRAAPAPTSSGVLSQMRTIDRLNADLTLTGLSIGKHPLTLLRPALAKMGVARCCDLAQRRNNSFVKLAGVVICRQRPSTAKGIVFLSLEDETGITNIVLMPDVFDRHRATVLENGYLLVRGIVQNLYDAVSVKALWVDALQSDAEQIKSHNFH